MRNKDSDILVTGQEIQDNLDKAYQQVYKLSYDKHFQMSCGISKYPVLCSSR